MQLDIVAPPHGIAPLVSETRRSLRLVLLEPEVLPQLREERELGARRVKGVEQRLRGLENVRVEVDPASRWDRLPRLVIDRQGDERALGSRDEQDVLARQPVLLQDREARRNQLPKLIARQIATAWGVRCDQRNTFGLEVARDPCQRALLYSGVEIVDDIAVDDRREEVSVRR